MENTDNYPFDYDPDHDGIGWQEVLMSHLEAALRDGEDPPKPMVKKILERTMKVEIPKLVREYLVKILDDEYPSRKVGRPIPSKLDGLFPTTQDMFPREPMIKAEYIKLTKEKGYTQQKAFEEIANKYKHLFRGEIAPSNDTIRKIVYSK